MSNKTVWSIFCILLICFGAYLHDGPKPAGIVMGLLGTIFLLLQIFDRYID